MIRWRSWLLASLIVVPSLLVQAEVSKPSFESLRDKAMTMSEIQSDALNSKIGNSKVKWWGVVSGIEKNFFGGMYEVNFKVNPACSPQEFSVDVGVENAAEIDTGRQAGMIVRINFSATLSHLFRWEGQICPDLEDIEAIRFQALADPTEADRRRAYDTTWEPKKH